MVSKGQMIHQPPRFQNTPIVFVSGIHVTDMDRLKGYQHGAVDYVSVPVAESHKLSSTAANRLSENAAMIAEASKQIRTISHLLHPPLLDEAGLASALQWYVEEFSERSKIEAKLDVPKEFAGLSKAFNLSVRLAENTRYFRSGAPDAEIPGRKGFRLG
jgi:CheY-like chemotaxis protein